MCLWLAYSGSPILIEGLLYKPDHSLIDQSLRASLGVQTINGGGFVSFSAVSLFRFGLAQQRTRHHLRWPGTVLAVVNSCLRGNDGEKAGQDLADCVSGRKNLGQIVTLFPR